MRSNICVLCKLTPSMCFVDAIVFWSALCFSRDARMDLGEGKNMCALKHFPQSSSRSSTLPRI